MKNLKKILVVRTIIALFFTVIFSAQAQAQDNGMLVSRYNEKDFPSNTVYYNEYEESDFPPEAIIKVRNNSGNRDQDAGTTETVFVFDGSGSRDEETSSSQLEVRFDFDNDGRVDTYFSVTKSEKHIFDTPGLKTIRMEVLDRGGNVSEAFINVNIVENTFPEAYFDVKPKIGTPGTEFQFNASLSNDSQYNQNLLKYRWDFNDDGKFDTKFNTSERLRHQFKTPGLKKITLEVQDPEGLYGRYSQMVMVNENTPSIASFAMTTRDIDESKAMVKMDARQSYDPDGGRLKYRWDFNYTGKNDIQLSTGWYNSSQTYTHFYRSGEYIIKLLTKDQDNIITTTFGKIRINLEVGE